MNDDREGFVPLYPEHPIRVPVFEKVPRGMDPMVVGDQGWVPLSSFEGCLDGNDAIAIGTGPSFEAILDAGYRDLGDFWTMGVNRVLRRFRPDFYVCAESRSDDLWKLIDEADPTFVFSTSVAVHRRAIRFHSNANVWLTRKGNVPNLAGAMSTWYAAALLAYFGAKTIGVLGVDLTGHYHFSHPSALPSQDRQWEMLRRVLAGRGQKLVNLSEDSLLTALPKVSFDNLRHRGRTTRPPMA